MTYALVAATIVVGIYAALVAALLIAGRREHARAVAGFVPDCVILIRRLLGDARVPRRRKLLLAGVLAYLAIPIDLVPDFIPVAGQLDDAILAGLALRSLLRATGPAVARAHWPGPPASFDALMRFAGARRSGGAAR
jgi:uncharacterized membrane protein YkvA (DUF1232 family)